MRKVKAGSSVSRWWDWPSVLLLVLAMLTASSRLETTDWTIGLSSAQDLSVLGAILGLILGLSRFSSRWAALLAGAYGAILVPWRLGLMIGGDITWEERLITMRGRLEIILTQISQKKDVSDSLLFILLMACLFWLLSVDAGYVLVRHGKAWRAAIPAGLAMLVIHYYHNCSGVFLSQCINLDLQHGSRYFAVYLLFTLLLVTRMVYRQHIRRWQSNRTFFSTEVSYDLARYAAMAVVVVVALAWAMPALGKALIPGMKKTWDAVNRPLHPVNEFFSHAFDYLKGSSPNPSPYYGASYRLGRGSDLSYALVFRVEVPQPADWGGNYYWRAGVYDEYQDGNWMSNYSRSFDYDPGQPDLMMSETAKRQVFTFTFIAYSPISILYVPPQPMWVNRSSTVQVADNPDGTMDVGWIQPSVVIQAGDQYQVRSSLDSVTADDLRAASSLYPDWVSDRYLQIPVSITPRMRQLAQQITGGYGNPYDMTEAVTRYLRTNIRYADKMPELPTDQELLDWFLFDQQQGFCNYYASAEVLLLRLAGIPARLAVGYSQGRGVVGARAPIMPWREQPSTVTGPYVYYVREREAHAWPEVYFPGIGWVEFEPTVSQLPIQRASQEPQPSSVVPQPTQIRPYEPPVEPTPGVNAIQQPEKTDHRGISAWRVLLSIAVVLLTLLLELLLLRYTSLGRWVEKTLLRIGLRPPALIRRMIESGPSIPFSVRLEAGFQRLGLPAPAFLKRWVYYVNLSTTERSYLEINRALRRLGVSPRVNDTPAERAATLERLLPQVTTAVRNLLVEYQRGAYSPHHAHPQIARRAGMEIRRCSYRTLLSRWLAHFQRPVRRENYSGISSQ